MSVWPEVTRLLLADKGLRELIIAPNAPVMSRLAEGCQALNDRVFTAAEVAEGLISACSHASGRRSNELGQAGIVCLGVRDIGRIRISYFTQRGSRVLRIVRIPFDVPAIDAVCSEPLQSRELVQAIAGRRYKAILIHGPAQVSNSQLCYALLGELNQTHASVIYVTERMLSFLMAHGKSVVTQVEVPTDAPSLEEAIQQALLLEPDVVHVGDVRATDDLPSLPQLISAGTCTLLSTVGEDPSLILQRLPESLHRSLAKHDSGLLVSIHTGDDGRLKLETKPWPC